ncbi:MAG: hypothetical protein ACRCZJ_01130 [Erysipelotrichaceae bacterium]
MMKFTIIFLTSVLLLTGCGKRADVVSNEEKYKKYNASMEAIINNKGVVSDNIPFDYEVTISSTMSDDGTFPYAIIIDNPQVAMYDIEALAIDPNALDSGDIFPSAGIVDDSDSMIPYQVDAEKGFPKGIILNGESATSSFTLQLMVTWKDYAKLNVYTSYFNVDVALEVESEDEE